MHAYKPYLQTYEHAYIGPSILQCVLLIMNLYQNLLPAYNRTQWLQIRTNGRFKYVSALYTTAMLRNRQWYTFTCGPHATNYMGAFLS